MRTRPLLAALAVLALAGCGSGATPTRTATPVAPSPTPAPEQSAAPAATPAPTTPALDVKVTFDGEACTYFGPAVILDGTVMRFEYVPDMWASLLVVGVTPGVTFLDFVEQAKRPYSERPEWAVVEGGYGLIHAAGTMLYTITSVRQTALEPIGSYEVACIDDSADRIVPAAQLFVAGP